MDSAYGRARVELRRAQLASGMAVLSGMWLIAAPFVLQFLEVESATWNHVLVGIAVASLAALRLLAPGQREGFSWIAFALGGWMIAAPFMLGYTMVTVAFLNSVVAGLAIVSLDAWSAIETNRAEAEVRHHVMANRGMWSRT